MDYRDDYERGRRYRDEGNWDDRREYDRRAYRHRSQDERGFIDRLADELRSWFHDQEGRGRDDRERDARWGGSVHGWGPGRDEDVDRNWARQWGYVDRGDQRGGSDRWRDASRRFGGQSWTRERAAGDEGYGAEREAGDRYYEPRSGWGDPSGWGAERSQSRESAAGSGPHAGRGPRGYQRSDDRIREDVCDLLCEHGFIDASGIEVTVLNGEVTLIGVVPDRPQKRMTEDAVEQISGVRDVHNQLRVSPGGAGPEPEDRPGDPRFRVA